MHKVYVQVALYLQTRQVVLESITVFSHDDYLCKIILKSHYEGKTYESDTNECNLDHHVSNMVLARDKLCHDDYLCQYYFEIPP